MELFEIVRERPSNEMADSPPQCPFRGCGTVEIIGTEWATHHRTQYSRCNTCERDFQRHTVGTNVWHTHEQDGRSVVLRGMPSCFESYVYHCAKCDGPVSRQHHQLDKDEPFPKPVPDENGIAINVLITKYENGVAKPQYRVKYACEVCGHGGYVSAEYWRPPVQPAAPRKSVHYINVGGAAPEEIKVFHTQGAIDEVAKQIESELRAAGIDASQALDIDPTKPAPEPLPGGMGRWTTKFLEAEVRKDDELRDRILTNFLSQCGYGYDDLVQLGKNGRADLAKRVLDQAKTDADGVIVGLPKVGVSVGEHPGGKTTIDMLPPGPEYPTPSNEIPDEVLRAARVPPGMLVPSYERPEPKRDGPDWFIGRPVEVHIQAGLGMSTETHIIHSPKGGFAAVYQREVIPPSTYYNGQDMVGDDDPVGDES